MKEVSENDKIFIRDGLKNKKRKIYRFIVNLYFDDIMEIGHQMFLERFKIEYDEALNLHTLKSALRAYKERKKNVSGTKEAITEKKITQAATEKNKENVVGKKGGFLPPPPPLGTMGENDEPLAKEIC